MLVMWARDLRHGPVGPGPGPATKSVWAMADSNDHNADNHDDDADNMTKVASLIRGTIKLMRLRVATMTIR